MITVPMLNVQRSTFNVHLPLSISPTSLFFCRPALRISAQITDKMQPRPNSISSPHSTDAAKNPSMAKTTLGTADVKNYYKSAYDIC
jgi:hypothetical protein